jgi:hypothetical protein
MKAAKGTPKKLNPGTISRTLGKRKKSRLLRKLKDEWVSAAEAIPPKTRDVTNTTAMDDRKPVTSGHSPASE